VDYLDIPTGSIWSRPLRGSPNAPIFVSFQLYGSESTIVEIAGARLGLTAGPMRGTVQLMSDEATAGSPQWLSLKHHFSTAKYSSRDFAALPTLTVRLDPASSTWDIYVGNRLVAAGLRALTRKNEQPEFVIRAGSQGVWLSGLVMSDDNPLYEDDNGNAIDDRFERETRGALQPRGASVADRKLLAEQWQVVQRTTPPPPLFVSRLMPDGLDR
jgi:hypothetical protein